MNFSGIGGITIVVVALLWFFVFIPSWFNASVERSQEKQQVKQIKRAVVAAKQPILKAPKTKVSSLSEQVYRAERTVRAFKFFTWMFSISAAALGLALNKFNFLTPYVVVSAVLAAISVRALVMAKNAQNRLLVGSLRSRATTGSNAAAVAARKAAEQAAQVLQARQAYQEAAEARAKWAAELEAEKAAKQFVATALPAPSYASHTGTLEVPEFAEVVQIGDKAAAAAAASESAAGQSASQNIDAAAINEILRRRRASGE